MRGKERRERVSEREGERERERERERESESERERERERVEERRESVSVFVCLLCMKACDTSALTGLISLQCSCRVVTVEKIEACFGVGVYLRTTDHGVFSARID